MPSSDKRRRSRRVASSTSAGGGARASSSLLLSSSDPSRSTPRSTRRRRTLRPPTTDDDGDDDLTSGAEGLSSYSGVTSMSSPEPRVTRPSFLSDPVATTTRLPTLLYDLPTSKKFRDFVTRLLWSIVMITAFSMIILSGHGYVVLMVIVIATVVFKEVIAIAHIPSKTKRLPLFRTIIWYFLFTTSYFLYGESLIYYFKPYVFADALFLVLAKRHRFISFVLYVIGIVMFVLSLRKGYYTLQFSSFGFTHVVLLLVVAQTHFIINNILEGMIWFILPVALVICNDMFAYLTGILFGRTRLIKLSPKKTWEGFVGGLVCTLLFGFFLAGWLKQFPYMTCPVKDLTADAWSESWCDTSPVFITRHYPLSPSIVSLIKHVRGKHIKSIEIAPIQIHALVFSVFASIIAPFGGFFASGFKRAFKIKDFADSIPGHGGVTDRMDCQFLMGFFANLYVSTFIRVHETTVGSILQTIVSGLTPQQQLELYENFQQYLEEQEMLLPSPVS